MRFFITTAVILTVLAVALLTLPFINTAVALDSQAPSAPEIVAIDPAPAAAIPVTDLSNAAPVPVAEIEQSNEAPEPAEAAIEDELDSLAAAETAAELNQQAQLDAFIASVTNGWAGVVTGVYVPNLIALPVGQQPAGNAGFITNNDDTATQFSLASDYGATGIIAHNYLAGDQFFQLDAGMQVYVIYGDGSFEIYVISEIRRFQALQPNSPYSNFLDLDNENAAMLSASQLFNQIYNRPGRLIFQTCIDAHGVSTWGRIFISADPIA